MPVPYFDFYDNKAEKSFYSDFIDESINFSGLVAIYCPRHYESIDKVLEEAKGVHWSSSYRIPVIPQDVQGFSGQDTMTQFGISFPQMANIIMSKRMFRNLNVPDRKIRPLEGDVIVLANRGNIYTDPAPLGAIFEITHVNKDIVFFPLGTEYVWQLNCKLFEGNFDPIKTGEPAMDETNLNNLIRTETEDASNTPLSDLVPEIINFDENNPFGPDF